jgi:acetyltransferase-like isoleucine patch superfamily enzyme
MFLKIKKIIFFLNFFCPPPVNKYIYQFLGVRFKNIKKTWVGARVLFDNENPETIYIGENCIISYNVIFINHSEANPDKYKKIGIFVGDNTFVGAGSIIMPNVKILENSTIGAGSVVTKNIEKNSVYAGNPAKLIKRIKKIS